jgi:iron-sulfur cluster assembly protein
MDSVTLALQEGDSLLEQLQEKGVPIAHDCGGTLACASCFVIVHEGAERLSAPSEDELDMLERAGVATPGARLACQATIAGDAGGVELVIDLPGRVDAPLASGLPVTVTDRAARFLKLQLAKHPGAVAVRLGVEPSGCSGLGYRIDPVEAVRGDDAVFDAYGVRVVVDPKSLPFVQGTLVDLVQEGLARRLRFDNPNARQSCGCGESFGA